MTLVRDPSVCPVEFCRLILFALTGLSYFCETLLNAKDPA